MIRNAASEQLPALQTYIGKRTPYHALAMQYYPYLYMHDVFAWLQRYQRADVPEWSNIRHIGADLPWLGLIVDHSAVLLADT